MSDWARFESLRSERDSWGTLCAEAVIVDNLTLARRYAEKCMETDRLIHEHVGLPSPTPKVSSREECVK